MGKYMIRSVSQLDWISHARCRGDEWHRRIMQDEGVKGGGELDY